MASPKPERSESGAAQGPYPRAGGDGRAGRGRRPSARG